MIDIDVPAVADAVLCVLHGDAGIDDSPGGICQRNLAPCASAVKRAKEKRIATAIEFVIPSAIGKADRGRGTRHRTDYHLLKRAAQRRLDFSKSVPFQLQRRFPAQTSIVRYLQEEIILDHSTCDIESPFACSYSPHRIQIGELRLAGDRPMRNQL